MYWVNFATTGDPNGKGVPRWPAYSPKEERVFEIGPSIGLVPIPNAAALDIIDRSGRRAEPDAVVPRLAKLL